MGLDPDRVPAALPKVEKKADVGERVEVFSHVGLLFDEPPGRAGLSFTKSSDDFRR